MVINHNVIIGENVTDMNRDPTGWMKNNANNIQTATGITFPLKDGTATAIPSTAPRKEVVGVSKPSAITKEQPRKHANMVTNEKTFLKFGLKSRAGPSKGTNFHLQHCL